MMSFEHAGQAPTSYRRLFFLFRRGEFYFKSVALTNRALVACDRPAARAAVILAVLIVITSRHNTALSGFFSAILLFVFNCEVLLRYYMVHISSARGVGAALVRPRRARRPHCVLMPHTLACILTNGTRSSARARSYLVVPLQICVPRIA